MAFLPVILVFILYFSGIPIAYALFGASLTYFGFINVGSPPHLLLQRFITSAQNFSLLAIFNKFASNHIFDLSGILLYISLAALLVFLTVQEYLYHYGTAVRR